jgi:hypothetical protein
MIAFFRLSHFARALDKTEPDSNPIKEITAKPEDYSGISSNTKLKVLAFA